MHCVPVMISTVTEAHTVSEDVTDGRADVDVFYACRSQYVKGKNKYALIIYRWRLHESFRE